MIAYMLTAIICFSLFTLSWFAWRLYTGEKKLTTQLFAFSMLFYGLGALSTTIGHAAFLMTRISYDPTKPLSLVFTYNVPLSMLFATFSRYFILEFGFMVSERRRAPLIYRLFLLGLIATLLLLMISPLNWYAMYPPSRNAPNIRSISNLLLLLINLLAIIPLIFLIARRIRMEKDLLKKRRLETIIIGFTNTTLLLWIRSL